MSVNRVMQSEREALEIKLRLLEEDFRVIQSGVNGAMRCHSQVDDLTVCVRSMEDSMRLAEAQRLRLQQEVMAGREAGQTMELAIVELSRMKDGMLGTLEESQHKLQHAMDIAEHQVREVEAHLQEQQHIASEELRRRLAAEEALRTIQIGIERGGASQAASERETSERSNLLRSEMLGLEEINNALKRELAMSETTRRHLEAGMSPGGQMVVGPGSPSHAQQMEDAMIRVQAMEEAMGKNHAETEALRRELVQLTGTLQDTVGQRDALQSQRDHLHNLLRARSGLNETALVAVAPPQLSPPHLSPPRKPSPVHASPRLDQLSPSGRASLLRAPSPTPPVPPAMPSFDDMDRNGDGVIDREEWQQAHEQANQVSDEGASRLQEAERFFRRNSPRRR